MIDDPLNRLHVLRGSALPQSKLTEADVREIRRIIARRDELRRSAAQLSNAKIAAMFGVHQRTIDRISAGWGWTHEAAQILEDA
jgi:hypothetical protein